MDTPSTPENHFATVPERSEEPRAAPQPRFAGVGARIQNRPGASLDQMANRIHPVRKR